MRHRRRPLLCSVLAKYPHLRGTVLKLPSVNENAAALYATRLGVADRCDYAAGDMFAAVPDADAYLMKMILHDWNDEECVRILRTAARSASSTGRMFIAEHLVPGFDTPHLPSCSTST